ncbi:CoA-transferase [Desulfofundulus salinus]|uniref:Glutaconate CoA-transferase n=1 Tax=Desulfofundulus salinus TaxID=2419843 RepID=A0A494X3C7_9FIRM|nr:CoA-transferase [Desulfofundulus salinum]RKO67420.1 glutaconate CoA-transferase [Desulfofundulus salinum]
MAESQNFARDYNLPELLVAAAARELRDGDVVFVGVGVPLLGALVAKLTHAPNLIMAMESGSVGPMPYRIVLGIGDNACVENAICTTSLWRLFADQQRGYFDVGMVGGAQVDKYGNLNSTAIFGSGDYYHPASRLPGSGGANDIASSAHRTVITIPLEKRRFLERVDYITSPGYLDGYNSRKKAGLPGGGPVAIITNKCIFRFDPETKEAYLDSVHPGVSVEEVRANVSWDLKVAPEVKVTPPPTEEQLRIIRIIDRAGIYTNNGLKNLTFESYIQLLEGSLEELQQLF